MNRTHSSKVAPLLFALAAIVLFAHTPYTSSLLTQVAHGAKIYADDFRNRYPWPRAAPDTPDIPQDFFGVSTSPITPVIDLQLQDLMLGDVTNIPPTLPPGETEAVDIEIVALSLRSVEPIQVSTPTGTEAYDVFFDVVPSLSRGQLELDRSTPTGGVVHATGATFLDIFYNINFAPTGQQPDGSLLISNVGLAPLRLSLDENTPWSETYTGASDADLFFLGTDGTSFDLYTFATSASGFEFTFGPAPEPTTLTLALLLAAPLTLRRNRRKRC